MAILGLFDGEILQGVLQWAGVILLCVFAFASGGVAQKAGMLAKIPWVGRFYQ